MSNVIKVGSGGGYKWSNFLHHAGWDVNEDIVRKVFPLTEAEIIINDGKDGIDVFTTSFFNPKRKWVFYPQALYDYNVDNIGSPDVQYSHENQVPKYSIYETVFRNETARRRYYRLSKQKVRKIYKHMNKSDFLITRRYFVFDIDDDYIIQDNARLMYNN